jgi:hypothetical protein
MGIYESPTNCPFPQPAPFFVIVVCLFAWFFLCVFKPEILYVKLQIKSAHPERD